MICTAVSIAPSGANTAVWHGGAQMRQCLRDLWGSNTGNALPWHQAPRRQHRRPPAQVGGVMCTSTNASTGHSHRCGRRRLLRLAVLRDTLNLNCVRGNRYAP